MTIQSAIYLAGNKRKLYKDIAPHLKGRPVLIDLFTGSGTCAINSVASGDFEEIIANEGLSQLYDLHNWLKTEDFNWEDLVAENASYEATKEDYLRLREDYNSTKDLSKLLLLHYRSNSNMIRFNSSQKFNMTYGERERFQLDRLKQHCGLAKNISFYNHDFGDMLELLRKDYAGQENEVVIYLDPPYYGTTACYSESGKWSENDNQTLFEYMDTFHDLGYEMVMSNVFQNRGVTHQDLIDWVKDNPRFEVHHLNISYNNSSFRKSDKVTDEVLIVSK